MTWKTAVLPSAPSAVISYSCGRDPAAPSAAGNVSSYASFSAASRPGVLRVFALIFLRTIFAPTGNSGAVVYFARSAKANGLGSAAPSGMTQSGPTKRLLRNSRRWTTMRSS